ncbi:hypothetical protein LCGC14_1925440 [marine sediment metagenome]|uniref:Uncharacterized protein n=1 Tax=marine sediment metagenome TaxID=412755 RepID=A0A0F9GCZ3_9ZZZZ
MNGTELIQKERKRQIESEGWSAKHDSKHTDASLALAAVCYAAPGRLFVRKDYANGPAFEDPWPESWEERHDKREFDGNVLIPNEKLPKKQRIRNLVKAGALIAAEIDRLSHKE